MQLEKYKTRTRHNVSESTVRSRLSALRKFKQYSNVTDEPTVEDVEKWVDHMIERYDNNEIKAGTIKQYYKAVKYYWDIVEGGHDDIEHIRGWIPTGDTDHGEYLERDELDKIRQSAYSFRDRCIIELMYWYARRPSEIVKLNREDVNFEYKKDGETVPIIKFPILKKDEARRATYEIVPEVETRLKQYLKYRKPHTVEAEEEWEDGEVEPLFTTSQGRISYSTVWKRIKRIANRAGIEKNITPKSMRHSRATHLDWSGESPEVIARQQLVHDPDSNVIGHYVHPRDDDDVRNVMRTEDEKNEN